MKTLIESQAQQITRLDQQSGLGSTSRPAVNMRPAMKNDTSQEDRKQLPLLRRIELNEDG